MMRPQHQMFMQQHGNQQRMQTQFGHINQRQQTNVHSMPDKMANPDWRQAAIMSQQQSINFNDNGNSLEFLDNLPVGDANYPQDLLESFNLNNFENENFLH